MAHKISYSRIAKSRCTVLDKWECTVCGYVYDPDLGDPERDIKPGTAFESLPEDWTCPLCGATKDQFIKKT